MLQEIRCDKFRKPIINFHSGLNVVLGDEDGSNSIGKSTALMVIDFVFGGNDYVTMPDVMKNVGEHVIQFCFDFGNTHYYFSRSTATKDVVDVCDEGYKKETSWSIDEYTQWLKEQYECNNLSLSFRNIVGVYSRIYGKKNLSQIEPLHATPKENAKDVIIRLIKLFDAYQSVDAVKQEMDAAVKKWETIRNAANEQVIIVRSGKTNKKDRDKRMQQLSEEIKSSELQLAAGMCSLTGEQMQAVTGMYEDLEQFNAHLMKRQAQLRRLKRSVADLKKENEVNIEELRVYFPTINMKRLEDVNRFHEQLAGVLMKEVREQVRKTESAIEALTERIEELNQKINAVLNAKGDNTTQMAVKRMMDRVVELERLKMEDKYTEVYDRRQEEKKEAKEKFENAQEKVAEDISKRLNKRMEQYNKSIYEQETNPPRLTMNATSYVFDCEDDSGAGTHYKGLILYDISVLEMTQLPILMHDSVLLKNISYKAIGRLLSLYQQFFDKQIFINLDEIGRYPEQVRAILMNNAVLELGENEKALFGRQWNKRK